MTVAQRILWQTAAGVFLVTAVVTSVTFRLAYETAKQRDLQHLSSYMSERAEREEARFEVVQTNLKLVREQFLKRLATPMSPEHVEERFNYWNRRYDDGAWRTRESFGDARKNASFWADKDWPATPEMRRQVVIAQELCDEMLPGWVDTFPSYYFQFPAPGLVNVGVDVLLADWSWKMPAHFDTTGLEWIAAALPEKPQEGFAWTGLQQDEVVSEPLVCTYLPVIKDGVFLASVGHNMPMSHMIDAAAHSSIPGALHFIFRTDGRLLAHPAKRAEILKSKGLLTTTNCGDTTLASLYRLIGGRTERRFSGLDPATDTYYSVARLAGPEWSYVTTVSRHDLRRQAYASVRPVLWGGLVLLTLVLGATGLVLRQHVTQPLAELTRATQAMSSGAPPVNITHGHPDELGKLASAFRDMNARVIARENELRQLNAELEQRVADRTEELSRFAAIAEMTSDFVGFAHLDAQVFYVNRAGRRMIGRPEDGPLDPFSITEMIAPVSHAYVKEVIVPASLRDGVAHGEIVMRRLDTGSEFYVSTVAMVIPDLDGRPAYLAAITRDVSERQKMLKETERALTREREVSELRANFVSVVSHEFRTPLEVILTSSDILARYLDRLSPEKRDHYLQTIHASVKRMGGMMEDVLLLGRVEAGKLTFKREPIDLGSLCGRVVDEMQSATSQRCPIELLLIGGFHGACGDESLLHHVLANLLSNAVKYSPPGAPVTLHLERVDDAAVFKIIDRGRGIPAADCTRIFESFQRGSNVSDTPGTGLGLLIAKKCVEIHDGSIALTSEEGRGTTFTVTLPLFRVSTEI